MFPTFYSLAHYQNTLQDGLKIQKQSIRYNLNYSLLLILKFGSIKFCAMNEDSRKTMSNPNIIFGKGMKICNELYTLSHNIGSGNFGQVFLAVSNSNKSPSGSKIVGVKIEKQRPGMSPHLPNEVSILKSLKADKNSVGFPEIYESGIEKTSHFLVMELLGPNLGDLMKMCGGKFSLETTLFLAMQIFERIQFLHSKGYVYKDIKPQNFLMGTGQKSSVLYMIDFGLCRSFRDSRINLHKPYRQQRQFSGNLRYASICSHLRIQHSRRDDLQSICYMLIYFLLGTLPWQSKRSENIDMKQRLILDKKLKMSTTELCAQIPTQFKNILEHCLDLDYYEDPDYEFIQSQLMDLHSKLFSRKKFVYDWAILTSEQIILKQDLTIKIKAFNELIKVERKNREKLNFQSSINRKQKGEVQWNDENEEFEFNSQNQIK